MIFLQGHSLQCLVGLYISPSHNRQSKVCLSIMKTSALNNKNVSHCFELYTVYKKKIYRLHYAQKNAYNTL